MKIARFQGHSDDTFACYSEDFNVDYDNCASGEPITMIVSVGEIDQLAVTGQYAPNNKYSGWAITVQLVSEDNPLNKGLSIYLTESDRPYSPELLIDGPNDMDVRLVDPVPEAEE